jgi:hypothetical protein
MQASPDPGDQPLAIKKARSDAPARHIESEQEDGAADRHGGRRRDDVQGDEQSHEDRRQAGRESQLLCDPDVARVLTSLVACFVSLAIVVLVAVLMGFRSPAGVPAWLAVAGILFLFTLALTWIAVIAGLSAKSVEGAGAFAYLLIFLPFISSAFVPTDTMPGPMRAFAENQPVTSIVNAIRDLFTQQPVGTDIWIALAWCVGILVVAYVLAMITYRRRIAT